MTTSYWDGRWFAKEISPPTTPTDPLTLQPQYIADETLSALRVVRAAGPGRVRYARPPELEARAPLGITTSAAASGGSITLIDHGELEDPSWSWIAGGPVLLGADGMLTQTQPSDQPFLVVMGVAVTSTTIVVRVGLPIFLNP